ncbi:MAG: ABC transporter permease [Terriglobales bacterium]
MKWMDLKLRLRALARLGRAERELQEEVAFHRAMAARAGASARGFGGEDRVLEECRDARGLRWLEDGGRDLRFALRRLRRTPAFTAAAVLTLTLGIGANTALFSLVDAALLRPLPVPEPRQLVALGSLNFTGFLAGWDDHAVAALTYSQYTQLRNENRVFTGVLAAEAEELTAGVRWGPSLDRAVPLKMVSANYFDVLGVKPSRGRFFDAAEATPTAAPEAVMSYGYWQRRFAGDPAVVGRSLRLHNTVFTSSASRPKGSSAPPWGRSPRCIFRWPCRRRSGRAATCCTIPRASGGMSGCRQSDGSSRG